MSTPLIFLVALQHFFRMAEMVLFDVAQFVRLAAHPRTALAAENLFLRKQLALFQERKVKPRRANDSTRWMMATLSRMFPWRDALVNVKADTLIRWHRKGLRLFWRWKPNRRADPACRRTYDDSSERWPPRIRPGARSALPTN